MYLAKSKNGMVGRVRKSHDGQAVIAPSTMGERVGNLYLSVGQIEADDKYWKQKDEENRAKYQAQVVSAQAKRKAQSIQEQKSREAAQRQQAQIPEDLTQRKLKKYFAQTMGMSQTERVARSLQADFSQTEMLPGKRAYTPVARADYQNHQITGNPLTRNGNYGPVTDFDRFVNGTENENDFVKYAAGTMYRKPVPGQFGWEWSDVGDWFADAGSNVADELQDQGPAAIAAAAAAAIKDSLMPPKPPPPPAPAPRAPGSSVMTYLPGSSAVNQAAASLGVPPAVLWGMGGLGVLIGLGVIVKMFK